MSTFLDGPAQGKGLMLRRAPLLLRVVIDETDGSVDALDQLDDTPGPSERIHVYKRVSEAQTVHLCARGKARGASGWYQMADYQHLPTVDGERLRETQAWRDWCESEEASALLHGTPEAAQAQ